MEFSLTRQLCSVGMTVFVDYYEVFKDDRIPSAEAAEALPEVYTLNSRRSRTTHARRIFREGRQRDALEMIIESDRLDPRVIQRARDILHGF